MKIAKVSETKQMFETNKSLLPPWLQQELDRVKESEIESKIQVEYNPEGYPLCRYNKDGKPFRINGRKPVDEVKGLCQEVKQENPKVLFLFGCEFGYLIFGLDEILSSDACIVVFEQDLCLLKATLSYFDFTALLQEKRLAFFLGTEEVVLKLGNSLFYNILCKKSLTPMTLFSFTARRNFKKEYLEVFGEIFRQLGMFMYYIGNDHQDTLIGYCNMVENTRAVLENPYLSCLKHKLQGETAFIIGNGPSLDQSIEELKMIQNRGIVIAVESAILPLMKHGIIPDCIVVLERTENTYLLHFKEISYPKEVSLLSLSVIDPRVYDCFSGEVLLLFRDGETVSEWINDCIGDGSKIVAGGNVSHLATSLAQYMGIDTIVFVGLNYAFGKDHASHSKDSIYSEKQGEQFEKKIQSQETILVEGNQGELLESLPLWVDFKTGLENIIALNSEITFINTTVGGAKIRGTVCKPLKECIQNYCKEPVKHRINEIIKQGKEKIDVTERIEKLKSWIQEIVELKDTMRRIVSTTDKSKLQARTLQQEWRKDKSMDQVKYEQGIHKLAWELSDTLSNPVVRLFMQQSVFVYNYRMLQLGIIDTEDKMEQTLNIVYEMSATMDVIAQSVSVVMEDSEEKMKVLLQELERKEIKGE